jgi:hypothetical protein
LYVQAQLQCNVGDAWKRNEDILKTGCGLAIKLSKISPFHVFLFDILGISVKIGAHTISKLIKCMTCLYFHVNI